MRIAIRLSAIPTRLLARDAVDSRRLAPLVAPPLASCRAALRITMAQRSITSFFSKAPRRSEDSTEEGSDETAARSPDAEQREVLKREHSDSDTSPHSSRSPTAHRAPEKKGRKRLRIESSDSEPPSPPPRSESTKCVKSERAKMEKSARAGKADTARRAVKVELSPLTEKDTNVKSAPASPPPGRRRTQPVALQEENDLKKKREVLERVTALEYSPGAAGYSPVADACWARGEPVPYLALARTLERIEATSARLRIVHTLSDYLRSVLVLTPADLLPSIYLCLNKLAPAYHSLELGVAETYLMKAIAQSTGRTLAQVKADAGRVGDLGLVAEQSRSTQRVMFRPAPLTVRHVFSALRDLAHLTGQSSMNKKIAKIQTLFVACRESEARYLIRSLAGKLRVGLAEQSVLQALAQAVTTTPPAQPFPPPVLDASRGVPADTFKARVEEQALVIKTTYCECPNYDQLVPVLLEHGAVGLPARCRLTPGVPLKPMLAHPTRGVHEVFQRFENVQFTCEWKYDGERAQIHVPEGAAAAVFSRNQENNTSKYPDVLGRLGAALRPSVASCVLDCEVVAWDPLARQILPFQVLSTRKRKDAATAEIKVQVCVFMFDLLYLNGRALVREPLAERRRLLHEHFNVVPGEWMVAESRDCGTLEEVQEFLEESVRGSCEGLMVKTLHGDHATYEIAKRSRNWLKLKKDYLEGVGDTVDAVVIGAYLGRGKRTGLYGGFLLACYDPDAEEFQSLCKIGTGFTDDDLQRHSRTLEQHRIPAPRSYYRYDASHAPDVWLAPAAVWEVRCADLSLSPVHRAAIGLVDPDKGISLRFPRFVREREDKSVEEATSARQIASVYLAQDQVKNQAGAARAPDDDFY